MKRCGRCGAEYGDDGLFCPYCDERYGRVMRSNDVVSGDFPEYKEDEQRIIGETAENYSFIAHKDEIYRRNNLIVREAALVDRETKWRRLEAKKTQVAKRKEQLDTYGLNKTVRYGAAVAAVCIALLAVSAGIQIVRDGALAKYEEKKQEELIEEYFGRNVYGKDGAALILKRLNNNDYWNYTFVYTNTTDEPVFHFAELFSGNENFEKAAEMLITYPSGAKGAVKWNEGVPDIEGEEVYISALEPRQLEIDRWRTVEPGEAAEGYLRIEE